MVWDIKSHVVKFEPTPSFYHRSLPLATTDADRERISRRIASADRRIDEIVYELYGLTEEEIKIVGGGK
jgi:hypothetical protein